jgi:hypothetical protein
LLADRKVQAWRGGGGLLPRAGRGGAESIKLFIEDQAFSLSYDLAPPPPFPVSKSYPFLSFTVCRWSSLLTGGGGGGNHRTTRKPGPL